MNRRSFLAGLGALIGGIAVDQAIPLGRVWSLSERDQDRGLPGRHYDVLVLDDLVVECDPVAIENFVANTPFEMSLFYLPMTR